MSSWIYPIGNATYYFELDDGTRVDATVENFIKHIKSRDFPEYNSWHIAQLYDEVETGDLVYIYSTRKHQNLGIIGCAIIEGKDDSKRKEIHLRFVLDKCRQLIEKPIPPNIVLNLCRIPYGPVGRTSSEFDESIEVFIVKSKLDGMKAT